MSGLHELAAIVRRWQGNDPHEGVGPLLPPGLQLIASSAITKAQAVVYEPMLCVILEGAKNTVLAGQIHPYRAGEYLVVSADLPVAGQVTEAPYLALAVPLDPAVIAELLIESDRTAADEVPTLGLAASAMDEDLLDAVTRLARLLERPDDAAVLGPMVHREIVWRLMCGERGAMVRQIGMTNGRLAQITRAIRWIRDHYAEPMRIEALAALAGMSETSLHRHFRAVTAMSPLQFQKMVRLQEARTRLLSRGRDVAGVGFEVGYDSPSQFSREYSRLFGRPPGRDLEHLRASPDLAIAV